MKIHLISKWRICVIVAALCIPSFTAVYFFGRRWRDDHNLTTVVQYLIVDGYGRWDKSKLTPHEIEVIRNWRDETGENFLHLAAKSHNLSACKFLVDDININPEIQSNSGNTPLDTARFFSGDEYKVIADYLRRIGAQNTTKQSAASLVDNGTSKHAENKPFSIPPAPPQPPPSPSATGKP